MKRHFVLTHQAEEDALTIWKYLADAASEKIADRFIADLFDACEGLSEMPGKGHARLDLLDDRHRFWSVKSYVIVYRFRSAPLEVIAIIHGARDLAVLLRDR